MAEALISQRRVGEAVTGTGGAIAGMGGVAGGVGVASFVVVFEGGAVEVAVARVAGAVGVVVVHGVRWECAQDGFEWAKICFWV